MTLQPSMEDLEKLLVTTRCINKSLIHLETI